MRRGEPASSLGQHVFLEDKGSLAGQSGATGQRKGAERERERGVGAFFSSERPFHCLLLP